MTKESKNKNYRLTLMVICLVLILCLIQLFISHRLATTGQVVKEFELKAAKIEQENKLLEEEISQKGSLTVVSQKAEQLGLTRTTSILYLTSQIPVALGTANVPSGH